MTRVCIHLNRRFNSKHINKRARFCGPNSTSATHPQKTESMWIISDNKNKKLLSVHVIYISLNYISLQVKIEPCIILSYQ